MMNDVYALNLFAKNHQTVNETWRLSDNYYDEW